MDISNGPRIALEARSLYSKVPRYKMISMR